MSKYTSKPEANRFLSLLDPTTKQFTFQTFDDNYDRKDPDLAKILHGTLEDNWEALNSFSDRGAGVFITVNRTNLKGRRLRHMLGTRANWIEDDGDARHPPIEPNFIVESSPGHHHSYILHALPKEDFAQIQNVLVSDYGSDPAAKDYSRVLRLPGFPHQKVRKEKNLTGTKFMVHVLKDNDIPSYDHDTLAKHFKFNGHAIQQTPTATLVDPDQALLHMVKEALIFIPADERSSWIAVSHAMKLMGDKGYALWDEWSRKSSKYDPAKNMDTWTTLNPERTELSALFYKARAHGMESSRVEECELHIAALNLPVIEAPKELPLGDDDWFGGLTMTKEIAEGIGHERWLIPDLIMAEALTVVCAPPNGGKTAILFAKALEIGTTGSESHVLYISADSNPQDVKRMYPMAAENNVHLVTPDFRDGGSMEKVIALFDKMLKSGTSLKGTVFFIDTLKKMVDMISKKELKKVLGQMRQLVSKQATVILVAHTNKYKGEDGTLVYEGTGDLRADVDNMIFFYPDKDPITLDLTVTTAPDKVRGIFHPITFVVDGLTREVRQEQEVVDTKAAHAEKMQLEKDRSIVSIVLDELKEGAMLKGDLVAKVRELGHGRNRIVEVLERYCVEKNTPVLPLQQKMWEYEMDGKAGKKFSLMHENPLPQESGNMGE